MKHVVTQVFTVILLTFFISGLPAVAPGGVRMAFADNTYEAGEANALPVALQGKTEIEKLTIANMEAEAAVADIEAQIAELQVQIDQLEAVLPTQQAKSDAGMKQRYIMQSNPLSIIESLLSAESIGDFLRETEYLERISKANLEEYNRTCEIKATIDAAKEEQEQLRESAAAELEESRAALETAKNERALKQALGVADARRQAETEGGEASVGKAAAGAEEQPEDYKVAATSDTSALADGADWMADRDAFIAEWTTRIDAYLEGSELEGQGVNFAASAWKYGVDPRWSPAISNTESSKGAVCIRPHNAWGWGAADEDPHGLAFEWESWEEAIDAHIEGLSRGYGYTISLSNAQKYCPITWQDWYNHTLGEMAKI